MNPLHNTNVTDFEIFLEEICFGKIVQFSVSKNNLAAYDSCYRSESRSSSLIEVLRFLLSSLINRFFDSS